MTTIQSPLRLFRPESISGSLSVYLPTTVAYRLVGLCRGVVLAWLMSESEFGLFQITLLAVNILNPLCSAGLNEAVSRYVPQYETKRSLRPFLARAVPLVLVVGVVLSAAAYFAAESLGRFLFGSVEGIDGFIMSDAAQTTLTRLVAGTAFGLIAYFLLLSILKGLRMFRAISLMELVNNLAFTMLAIALAWGGWSTAATILGCYGATLFVVMVLFALPLSYVIRNADDQKQPLTFAEEDSRSHTVVGQMLRFSTWAALAAVMWQTLQYYPMWYLQKVHGPEVAAVFGGVRHITQVVLIGAVTIATVVQTAITKTWESRGKAEAGLQLLLAFKATALLLFVGCTIIAAMAGVIIRLFPASYAYGAGIIPTSLMFFMIGGHLVFLSTHFILLEKTRYLFWPWAVGVVCNVALALWMVQPELESSVALAAAVWCGVFSISGALLACLFLMGVERRPLDWGSFILLASTYALALPIYFLVLVVLVIVILACGTQVMFSVEEKELIRKPVAAAGEKIRRMASTVFR